MNKNLSMGLLIIGLAIGGGLYFVIPQGNTLYESYKGLETVKLEITDLDARIEQLKREKEEHDRVQKNTSKPIYFNENPSDDAMSAFGVMFEDVIQAAKHNHLRLFSIAYNMAPSDDIVYKNVGSEYHVCEIAMQLIGKYADFSSYFEDIYKYPYVMNLSTIEIKPYERDKKILIGDIKVVMYSKKLHPDPPPPPPAPAEGAPQG